MPFKLSPRLRAFDYTGLHRYFLTICAHDRRQAFIEETAVARTRTTLFHTASDAQFAVIAYCFMPDHFHAVVEGTTDGADFLEFVRIFKQVSSFEWKRATGAKLWQRGYYERVLRGDEDTVTAARYLLNNPVRAGLARQPCEYPFVGSVTLELKDLLGSIQT